MVKKVLIPLLGALALTLVTTPALADWAQVIGADELQTLYTNKTFRGTAWIGYYCADGRGVVRVAGENNPRTWRVEGDDQVCIDSLGDVTCYTYERNDKKQDEYRAIRVDDHQKVVMKIEDKVPEMCGS